MSDAAARATDPLDPVGAVLSASRALVAVSARSVAAAGDVTLPQFRMLVVLEAGPSNLGGLAAALDVAASTAVRMVDRLVAAGLVARGVVPTNRRESHLELTAAGRRTVTAVTERRRRDLAAVLERIPARQQVELAAAMTSFAAAAESLWPGITPPAP